MHKTKVESYANISDMKYFEEFDNLVIADSDDQAFLDEIKLRCLDIQVRMRTGLKMKKYPNARVFVQMVRIAGNDDYNLEIIVQKSPGELYTNYGYIECVKVRMFHPYI